MYTVTAENGSTAKYTVIITVHRIISITYFGSSDNNFYAFDAVTGLEKWRHSVPNGLMTSSPLIVSQSNVDHSGDSGSLQ